MCKWVTCSSNSFSFLYAVLKITLDFDGAKNRLDNLKNKAPNLYRPWNQHGPWKLMVGKWNFLLGCPIFRCYAAMFFLPQQMEPTRDSTWGVRHATFNIACWPSWLAITLQSYFFGCFWRETGPKLKRTTPSDNTRLKGWKCPNLGCATRLQSSELIADHQFRQMSM